MCAMITSRPESASAKAAREAAAAKLAPSGPVRVLTPEERAAFLQARPDLAKS